MRRVLAGLARGSEDPTARAGIGHSRSFWAVARELDTDVLVRFEQRPPRSAALADRFSSPIDVRLWAESGERTATAMNRLSARLPDWVGVHDDWGAFIDGPYGNLPPRLQRAYRENPGIRLPASGQLWWHTVSSITEQRVTSLEAFAAIRRVLRTCGTPVMNTGLADQPPGMFFPPSPQRLRQVPAWTWHQAGYDRSRSEAVLRFAAAAPSLQRIAEQGGPGELARALHSVAGIGPWTVAEVLQRTHGHPDAVSVGDYHLAHHVGWAFEGRRADDRRMLELLAPFAGHRNRVIALIRAAGAGAPRRGAKYAPQDHRWH